MQLDTLKALYEGLLMPLSLGMPRMLAMMMVFPLLPTAMFPALLRNSVAISLVLITCPLSLSQIGATPPSPLSWLLLIGKEVLIGAAIGWVFALLVWSLESVGALIDIQTGSNNGAIFDPINNESGGPWAPFMRSVAIVLFLSYGGLMVMLGCLYRSYIEWPITSFYPPSLDHFESWSIDRLKALLASTASLATPVIGVLLVVEMGIGLVNRAVPQLNVFTFSMPIKGAVAVVAVLLTMQYYFDITRFEFTAADKAWRAVSSLFAPLNEVPRPAPPPRRY
jgi:type III secretion protein T